MEELYEFVALSSFEPHTRMLISCGRKSRGICNLTCMCGGKFGQTVNYLTQNSTELCHTNGMSGLLFGFQILLGTGGVPALVVGHVFVCDANKFNRDLNTVI